MALIHCSFHSTVLGLSCSLCAILPEPVRTADGLPALPPQRKYATLWLLHGISDDHTTWQRRTSIERYVEGRELAVIMPAVHRSFYTNMVSGSRYWTFISEELPTLARALFPLSAVREDNFAAGLSMGGYGAFKLAMTHPDRYAAAASLSGGLDVVALATQRDQAWQVESRHIFGPPKSLRGSENDLLFLAEQLAFSPMASLPFYQWCGTEDDLYQNNQRFRERAVRLGLNLTYEEGPGKHEWSDWDRQIQRVLDWLPLRK